MQSHPDGSVTYTKDEVEALSLIAGAFIKVTLLLEQIVTIMDTYEVMAGKFDTKSLFGQRSFAEQDAETKINTKVN